VAAYARDELQSVYRDFYTPENAILILVGDFDAASMQRSVEKIFGNWTGKKPAALESAKPPVPEGRRVYLVDLAWLGANADSLWLPRHYATKIPTG